jgi:hypothetical protein
MDNKNCKINPWTEEDLGTLYLLRQEGIPYKIIALELKRTINACERKYQSTVWQNTKFYDKVSNCINISFKKAHLEKIAQANDKRLEVEKFRTEIIADRMVNAIDALPKVKKPIYVCSEKKEKIHSTEDVGLLFSDTHIGHHHTLEETGGLSEYSEEIFKKRVNVLKKATSDIVELHSHLYKLPTLHIFSLGDIVAGMNNVGNWSPTYINMPIYDQMASGFEAISDMIYYWLGLFENINFYGIAGNHGRAAQRGVEKEYVNWDYLCYKFLEARFKDNPRVKMDVPKTWWMLKTIRNHKFLMVHGDDVRGGTNAINGLKNYEQKMMGVIGDIPDYTLAAHFHHAAEETTNHGKIIINGSFLGPDIYSLKDLQSSAKPEQKIFGIHDKRGITWSYNLDLSIDR